VLKLVLSLFLFICFINNLSPTWTSDFSAPWCLFAYVVFIFPWSLICFRFVMSINHLVLSGQSWYSASSFVVIQKLRWWYIRWRMGGETITQQKRVQLLLPWAMFNLGSFNSLFSKGLLNASIPELPWGHKWVGWWCWIPNCWIYRSNASLCHCPKLT